MSTTTAPQLFASPQLRALCAELAPVLARVPRAPSLSFAAMRDRIYRGTKRESTLPHGFVAVHVRRWLDMPESARPKVADYCARHGVLPSSFDSSVAAERALRADPVALANRDRLEQAAGWYLDRHPGARETAAARSAFASAHQLSGTAFAAAVARVRLMRQIAQEAAA